jgi:hypothetical protein
MCLRIKSRAPACTHYDYVGLQKFHEAGFFWLALGPQLVFWVSFTVVLGMLSGSVVAAAYTRLVLPNGHAIQK